MTSYPLFTFPVQTMRVLFLCVVFGYLYPAQVGACPGNFTQFKSGCFGVVSSNIVAMEQHASSCRKNFGGVPARFYNKAQFDDMAEFVRTIAKAFVILDSIYLDPTVGYAWLGTHKPVVLLPQELQFYDKFIENKPMLTTLYLAAVKQGKALKQGIWRAKALCMPESEDDDDEDQGNTHDNSDIECPEDYTAYKGDCFQLINTKVVEERAARKLCAENDGHLARFHNKKEYWRIKSYAASIQKKTQGLVIIESVEGDRDNGYMWMNTDEDATLPLTAVFFPFPRSFTQISLRIGGRGDVLFSKSYARPLCMADYPDYYDEAEEDYEEDEEDYEK